MSKSEKMAMQHKVTATFYWIGVAMSVVCVALVGRVGKAPFPLSWAAGAVAILAFLAAEYCHPAAPAKDRGARRVSQEQPENLPWETEFADS